MEFSLRGRTRYYLNLAFLGLAVAFLVIAGYLFHAREAEQIRSSQQHELSVIAGLKVHQIDTWRKERAGDAWTMAANGAVARQLRRVLDGQIATREELLGWMQAIRTTYDYEGVWIANGVGETVIVAGQGPRKDTLRALREQAWQLGRPVLGDLERDSPEDGVHLDVVVPIPLFRQAEEEPLGFIVLRINPQRNLYPMIKDWPTISSSAESLLVRREGNEVVFLNDPRHRRDSALTLRFGVSVQDLPAARAVRELQGGGQGVDYRGVEVFADWRRVPDSSWSLVTKIDVAEVNTPIRVVGRYVLVVVAMLILALFSTVAWLRRLQHLEEMREQLRREEEAKQIAQAADRAKGIFLANMSHEIRTPTSGVIGLAGLLADTSLEIHQRELLRTLCGSAESLLRLIDDVLDFARMEARTITLVNAPFQLRSCVYDALLSAAVQAHEKGLEIHCRFDPAVPDNVVGDDGRVRQVLLNLVGNALRFTRQGEVRLTVAAESVTPKELLVQVSVRDTGPGIPKEQRERIFEAFCQIDGSLSRKVGGAGLGLTIARELAERMGGRVWVGEESPGATFHFTCALELGSGPAPTPRIDWAEGQQALIIERSKTGSDNLRESLLALGFHVEVAENPLQGSSTLALVVASIPLDPASHKSWKEQLAGLLETAPKAVVVLLRPAARDLAGEWFPSNSRVQVLLRPPSDRALCAAIERARRATQEQEERKGSSQPPAPAGPSRTLRVLVVEDDRVNQKVLSSLLKKRGHDVAVAENGKIALERVSRCDFDLVLMDVQMPEMDGLQATAAIRGLEAKSGKHVPIIALTAHALEGDRQLCLDAGMDDYLPKPIRPAQLDSLLARFLLSEKASGAPTQPQGT